MDSANARAFSPHPVAFEDGLGQRRVTLGATSETVEVLTLRAELASSASFESALRERVARLADFRSEHFGRVRSVDKIGKGAPRLGVTSDHVPGIRLSQILSVAERQLIPVETNAALCLIRQLVHATAVLHDKAPDTCHGALGPERLILTPQARLVVVDYVFGSALEQLRYSNKQYWQDLRVALPRTFGMPLFDRRTDVAQIGATALALIIGRPLSADEFPNQVGEMTDSALVLSPKGTLEPLPLPLKVWLQRAIQVDSKTPFGSALDAWAELDRVLHYSDPIAEVESLKLFMSRYFAIVGASISATAERPAPKIAAVSTTPAAKSPVPERPRAPERPAAAAPVAVPKPRVAPQPAAQVEPVTGRPTLGKSPSPVLSSAEAPPPVPAKIAVDAPAAASPLTADGPVGAPAVKERGGFWDPPAQTQTPEEAAVPLVSRQSVPAFSRSSRLRLAAGVAMLVILVSGLTLAARRYLMQPVSTDGMGSLVVQTNPAGAAVTIDGEPRGETPLSIDLQPGRHTLKISNDGNVRSIPVTITAGGQVSQLVDLPRSSSVLGELRVRTEPAGALVTVDGHDYGKSPVTVEGLSPGTHSVVLAGGLGRITQQVKIDAGTTASLLVPLTPPKNVPVSGWISVKAPADVQVYEGGQLLGSSRSSRIMLSVGRHELQVVNQSIGFQDTQVVDVRPGRVESITPKWPTGTMSFNAIPWADVWVDGRKVGETPLGNVVVPIGHHDVVFRHPDFGERNVTAVVTAGEPAMVSVDLRQK